MRFACKIALVVLAVTLIASYASATVINGDIQESNGTSGTYSGQGAYSDGSNNYWTAVTLSGDTDYTSKPLYDSTGAATTATFAITTQHGGGAAAAGANPLALWDFVYNYSGWAAVGNFTISGLTPNGQYSMYLYGACTDGSNPVCGTYFSFDNFTTTYATTGASLNGFQAGVNYVVVNSVTADGTGKIIGQFKANPLSLAVWVPSTASN